MIAEHAKKMKLLRSFIILHSERRKGTILGTVSDRTELLVTRSFAIEEIRVEIQ